MTKMKAFRLPDTAWELLGELAKRYPAHPPARKGRVSVVLWLLRREFPGTQRERELHTQMFPLTKDEQ